MLAVSFASWLDLPGYSISECLGGTPIILRIPKILLCRLPSVAIASYMECYAKQLALRRNIRPQMKVTSITKQGEFWLTEGRHKDGRPFSITSRQIVLACGKTKSRTLGVRYSYLIYSSLFYAYAESEYRIIIVGDGISSADAVRYCLENDLPVLHIIRRTDGQLRSILMSRLSPSHYVEYHSIYRLMVGRDTHSLYQRYTASNIIKIENDYIIVRTPKGDIEVAININ
uniref:Pyr_redox_2 domain-containing protein n=1 Tax=Heterorhabditis bacteriophora TaxID=37862 RepID=A0A1I7WCV3_HETBA